MQRTGQLSRLLLTLNESITEVFRQRTVRACYGIFCVIIADVTLITRHPPSVDVHEC